MSDLAKMLGKMLLPGPEIAIDVCTVGGIDSNGNEVEEPTVFDGRYNEAVVFFEDERNLNRINAIFQNMEDGYIVVTCGNYARQVYDVDDIMDAIESMIY